MAERGFDPSSPVLRKLMRLVGELLDFPRHLSQHVGGFVLTQEPGQQTGVVVYRALYRGEPAPAGRRAAWQGVVFVTMRMQRSVEAGMGAAPSYLRWCLVDRNPAAARPHLAGADGCQQAPSLGLRHDAAIALGDQSWLLRIEADPAAVPDAGNGNAWLFSTVGLLPAAMLAELTEAVRAEVLASPMPDAIKDFVF